MSFSLVELLVLLLIAGICGGLAQTLTGFSRGGCLATIAMGFIGALLGTWMARLTGLPELFAIQVGEATFPVIWSIIGGAVFAALLSWMMRPRTVR